MKKKWIKKNDKLWADIIKAKARYKCEICGRKNGVLHAHHLFVGRRCKMLRWNLKNGVCVCFPCHQAAHNSPLLFRRNDYFRKLDFKKTEEELLNIYNNPHPLTEKWYQEINEELKQELKKYVM